MRSDSEPTGLELHEHNKIYYYARKHNRIDSPLPVGGLRPTLRGVIFLHERVIRCLYIYLNLMKYKTILAPTAIVFRIKVGLLTEFT